MDTTPRIAAGTPSGGRFAARAHAEAPIDLDATTQSPAEAFTDPWADVDFYRDPTAEDLSQSEWEETLPEDPANPVLPDVSDPMNDPNTQWEVCCPSPLAAAANLCGCGGGPYL